MTDVLEKLRDKKLTQLGTQLAEWNRLREQAQSELNVLVGAYDSLLFSIMETEAHIRLVERRIDVLNRDLGDVRLDQLETLEDAQRKLWWEKMARCCQLERLESELAQLRERKESIRERVAALAQALATEPPQLAERCECFFAFWELPPLQHQDRMAARQRVQQARRGGTVGR